eukprot:6173523-Pleurochrysis_carterae.AAC.1
MAFRDGAVQKFQVRTLSYTLEYLRTSSAAIHRAAPRLQACPPSSNGSRQLQRGWHGTNVGNQRPR